MRTAIFESSFIPQDLSYIPPIGVHHGEEAKIQQETRSDQNIPGSFLANGGQENEIGNNDNEIPGNRVQRIGRKRNQHESECKNCVRKSLEFEVRDAEPECKE